MRDLHTIERWDDATGKEPVEEIASVGDFLVAMQTYLAAVRRWPDPSHMTVSRPGTDGFTASGPLLSFPEPASGKCLHGGVAGSRETVRWMPPVMEGEVDRPHPGRAGRRRTKQRDAPDHPVIGDDLVVISLHVGRSSRSVIGAPWPNPLPPALRAFQVGNSA